MGSASVCPLASVVLAVFAFAPSLPGQVVQKRCVAVLFPNGSSVSGEAPFGRAIQSVHFGKNVVFNPEYLDDDNLQNPQHEEAVAQYLHTKYAAQKVDVVMPVGFAGLSFALRHGTEIFGNTRFVFFGVEQSRLEGVPLPPIFTGVTHLDDVRGTVEVALALQPDTTEVAVIGGSSEYDKYWLHHDRVIFDTLTATVHFRYLTDLPMLALLRELNQLKPHTIAFYHTYNRDGSGQDFGGLEALELIVKNTNAPLYGLIARDGLVGGRPSGDNDGRSLMALEMVRRILGGEDIAKIPLAQAKAANPYVFDAKQLSRWNIDSRRVPPGSLIVNRAPSFWQLHRTLILSMSSFVALESALIAVLLIQRARRRRAEALLAERNARLEESQMSLRQLTGQLIGAQEEERRRIARELHDDLNQQVAHLAISLSDVKRRIATESETVREDVVTLQNGLLRLSDGLRHISHELHPGMLELFGLAAALKAHCREFSAVTSIPVQFEGDCNEPVPPDVALCVYRIAQESLRNVYKHARARSVNVRLTVAASLLQLVVSDDGIGFDVQEARTQAGLGLRSMEERMWLVHGAIDLSSVPGSGTVVTVTIDWAVLQDVAPAARTIAQNAG
jgi:signal transduction histidine kinase